ncbi:rhomboid family intramembrane serine protease [Streptomyces sp. SAI-170]|uniref:rhomboid family intramembrane serine protease n=1 Tax=Streptomyces sp. SAI-170 TaxID=3377729 RepID=UPI003C7ABB73
MPGTQILAAVIGPGRAAGGPLVPLGAWRRPFPVGAAALVALMTAFAVAQSAFPAMVGRLERVPDGAWWRVLTALLVQSSGWFQIVFNLAALIAVAPVAEWLFGTVRMLGVYVTGGVAAQVVSAAGWSPHGAGNSVAVCALVGALAAGYALRGSVPGVRRLALLVPAAGTVLCLLADNHGVGLLVGAALGTGLTLLQRTDEPVGRPATP